MNLLPAFTNDKQYFIGTKTWKLNFDDNIVCEFIDGQESIKQSIYFILNCCKYKYPIFDFDFGIDLDLFFIKGSEKSYYDIEKMIKEALLLDDRILDVTNFQFKFDDCLFVDFTVVCYDMEILINYKFDKEVK